jgi:Eukaryotic aspartyl protease
LEQGQGSVVGFDIQRKNTKRSANRDLNRLRRLTKRDPLQVTLDNEQALYFANVTMGTPAQSLRLDIDTGSSDIWANSATSSLCLQDQCTESGTFNANGSSSYTYVNSEFQIQYADGSYATGDYATDTLNIGGTAIKNVPFGIGYESTSPEGVMGIGYMTNEAAVSTTGSSYFNLPSIMKQAGIIESMSYSLWLNDLDASSGSILFGGIDAGKFTGTLATLPIIQEQGVYREFIIALTGLTVKGQTILSGSSVPVLLDSGSSLTYLPTSYAQAVFKVFNANYDASSGEAIIDCSLADSTEKFVYSFSGVDISVDLNELVITVGVSGGVETCILGMLTLNLFQNQLTRIKELAMLVPIQWVFSETPFFVAPTSCMISMPTPFPSLRQTSTLASPMSKQSALRVFQVQLQSPLQSPVLPRPLALLVDHLAILPTPLQRQLQLVYKAF